MELHLERHRYLPAIALFAGVLLTSSLANASVIVTGQLVVPNPIPTDLTESGPAANSSLFYIIPEVTNVILPQDVSAGGIIGGTIPMGTKIDAYIIHADTLALAGTIFTGSVTFDTPILGIYVSDTTLDFSDGLAQTYGSPIVTYPTGFVNRGLELPPGGNDSIILSPDHRTVTLTLNTSGTSLDELRLLVATPVPEPASLGMAGLGLLSLGFVAYRRRRA
ncbi:MAG: PEP-CTERM sorting domain-containing protein [Bryobacteraceae bacterium]